MAANKARTEKQIVIALACIFVISLATSLQRMGFLQPKPPGPAPAPVMDKVPLAQPLAGLQGAEERLLSQLEAPLQRKAPEEEAPAAAPHYAAQQLREPFESLLAPESAAASAAESSPAGAAVEQQPVVVQGLLWGGAAPTAIINHRLYRVGDTLDGAVIRSIDRQGVALERRGTLQRFTIRAD